MPKQVGKIHGYSSSLNYCKHPAVLFPSYKDIVDLIFVKQREAFPPPPRSLGEGRGERKWHGEVLFHDFGRRFAMPVSTVWRANAQLGRCKLQNQVSDLDLKGHILRGNVSP
jgi:hypothetical protein